MEYLAGDERAPRPRGRYDRAPSSYFRRSNHHAPPGMMQHQRHMPHNMLSPRRTHLPSSISTPFSLLNTPIHKHHTNTHICRINSRCLFVPPDRPAQRLPCTASLAFGKVEQDWRTFKPVTPLSYSRLCHSYLLSTCTIYTTLRLYLQHQH